MTLLAASVAVLSALSAEPQATQSQAQEQVRVSHWVGHQVVFGKRKLPVLGELETRADTYILAEKRDGPEGTVLVQRACAVTMKPVAGVEVRVPAERLAPTKVRLQAPSDDNSAWTGRSRVQWSRRDVDRDGKPGMSVTVDAAICSGVLHVANDTRTTMRATLGSDEIAGSVRLTIDQTILDVEGRCLSATAKDTHEKQSGRVRYQPVAAGTTCEDLSIARWPVKATR